VIKTLDIAKMKLGAKSNKTVLSDASYAAKFTCSTTKLVASWATMCNTVNSIGDWTALVNNAMVYVILN